MNEKRALVTGGTGFIGSHLVEYLQQQGYTDIRCLVRSDPKWLRDIEGITLVRGHLMDTEALEAAVEGVQFVYHLAGVTRAPEPAAYFRGNVEATLHLLDVVRRVQPNVSRVLITSSLAAVGPSPDDRPLTEEDPLRPISTYGRSKAEMERRVQPYMEHLPITIVRPPAVYGPRERDIYTFFRVVRRGICPIVGNAHRPRINLIHVQDLVRGLWLAAETPEAAGEIFFVGSAEHYTWPRIRDAVLQVMGQRALTVPLPGGVVLAAATLTEIIGRLLGTYPPFNREKAREMLASWMCSIEKARRILHFQPELSLETGLEHTIAWYRQHGWL